MNDTDRLIQAAEERAAIYDGDDRPFIKTDVLNAFFAGAKWAADDARVERIQPIADPRGIVSGNTLTLDVEPVGDVLEPRDTIFFAGIEHYADLRFRLGAGNWTYEERQELGRQADEARAGLKAMCAAAFPPKMGMQGWIPVSERLPEEEEYVLVRVAASPIDMPTPWIGEGRYAEDEFDEVMRWSVAGPLGWAHPVNVTHWMPKPIAPGVTSGVLRQEGKS